MTPDVRAIEGRTRRLVVQAGAQIGEALILLAAVAVPAERFGDGLRTELREVAALCAAVGRLVTPVTLELLKDPEER